ncbi:MULTISPECIES: hypothetical protein [Psychrobacter]|uniref:Uncharacterized protein n=1 Tax=Psychrobacter proteolyticus TaxID=147825 RepID=A0ABV0D3P6_9GAMM
MSSVYEDKRIPLQVRRLMIFSEICLKAKQYPYENVYVDTKSQLAFSVMYFSKSKKYVAYGSVFEYSYISEEGIKYDFNVPIKSDYSMCQITVKGQPFTRSVRTPLGLLIDWNKYVKNKVSNCFEDDLSSLFLLHGELEKDYVPHRFYEILVSSANLPLWDN